MSWMDDIFSKENQTVEGALADLKAVFPKFAVPKEQYNTKVTELTESQTELQNANGKLEATTGLQEEIAKLTKDNEELKTSFDSQHASHEEYKTGVETQGVLDSKKEKFTAILRKNKVNEETLPMITKNVDYDSFTIDGGNLVGFEDTLSGLRESMPTQFSTTTTEDPNGKPASGGNPNNDTSKRWW